jgi:hypothetical protein
MNSIIIFIRLLRTQEVRTLRTLRSEGSYSNTARKTEESIKEGQAVKCDASEETIYRYTNEQLRPYPNTAVASSWTDSAWNDFIVVECDGIPIGSPMVPQMNEGQPVKCEDESEETIYRYTNEQLQPYPDDMTASSWDPAWNNFVEIDCSGIPIGPVMVPQMFDGQAVKCDGASEDTIYRYTNKQLQPYPDDTIARSWDPAWNNFIEIDCDGIPIGPPMEPRTNEGQAVKCDASEDTIYRYTNQQLRAYPDDTIASSWDPAWSNFEVIDCSGIPIGQVMKLTLIVPSSAHLLYGSILAFIGLSLFGWLYRERKLYIGANGLFSRYVGANGSFSRYVGANGLFSRYVPVGSKA